MVELRPDWCLSRQRYWGVPIPALVCNNCLEEILLPEVIDNFAAFVSKEGTDSWFQRDIKDFLSPGFKCPHCKQDNFSSGSDILDVWFDSGVSHQAVLKKRKDLGFPCDLYLEGSDQHRGWFQSSLIPSMCIDGRPPFKSVLTHGFVVDGKGQKMSKSLGNVISPLDIIKDFGADILRLWVASSDYNEDIRISGQILSGISESYRKIRNTARFILGNLFDFNPGEDRISYDNLKKIDKWILFKLSILIEDVTSAYENFEFYKAFIRIYDFCNESLSMNYLDMVKGRLYTFFKDSKERRATQSVMYEILAVLVRIIAPILVFTAEEIYKYMPKEISAQDTETAHLLGWPKINPVFKQYKESELRTIMDLIPTVSKILEEKRKESLIGSSFDAKIKLLTNKEIHYKYLESLKDELSEIFKVSQVNVVKQNNLDSNLTRNSDYPDIAIEVHRAEGLKCQRCWNYSISVGANKEHTSICEKCLLVIGGK
jgi:isoleucyl-tRNA synthetase